MDNLFGARCHFVRHCDARIMRRWKVRGGNLLALMMLRGEESYCRMNEIGKCFYQCVADVRIGGMQLLGKGPLILLADRGEGWLG
jgi:hypothetical protein